MVEQDNTIKILCVDGDTGRLGRYHELIAAIPGHEFHVLTAEDAGQGLSLAQTFHPNCIVLAAGITGISCLDFIARLGRPDGASAPALVIAAAPGEQKAAMAAMGAGAEDFVEVETLSAETLQRAIGNALAMVRMRAIVQDAKQQLAAMGLDDPLTSLAGRNLFQDRLTHAVILGKRSNQNVGVMLIELNDLKDINFMKGHEAGDAALREVGERLKTTLRQADTVARTNGNQFGVVLHTGATYDGAIIAAQKIMAAMEAPMQTAEGPLELKLDIGIALFPSHGEDGDTLLYNADAAMTQARRSDGGYAVFAYDDMLVDFLDDDASVA
jgi:diguanylate cyclase (GGDEF)-like protein